jgi:hypothetical protein
VTQIVLRTRPELLDATLHDARMTAEALDGVWTHLDRIVRHAQETTELHTKARRQSETHDFAQAVTTTTTRLCEVR